jgi:hypothetical protein
VQFLNQSWDNLADVNEELIKQQEAELIATLANEAYIDDQIHQENQHNIDASGFKLVTGRSTRKKIQKDNS